MGLLVVIRLRIYYQIMLFGSRDRWLEEKQPLIRKYERLDSCLIFDDTIVEKSYTDENELICWNYDHFTGRNVKRINLLTAFYHVETDESVHIPVGYESVCKS